jgi:hypothetical protein
MVSPALSDENLCYGKLSDERYSNSRRNVQNRADGTSDASVYNECINTLLKEDSKI